MGKVDILCSIHGCWTLNNVWLLNKGVVGTICYIFHSNLVFLWQAKDFQFSFSFPALSCAWRQCNKLFRFLLWLNVSFDSQKATSITYILRYIYWQWCSAKKISQMSKLGCHFQNRVLKTASTDISHHHELNYWRHHKWLTNSIGPPNYWQTPLMNIPHKVLALTDEEQRLFLPENSR